jgi:hypothetical protein
MADRGKYTQNEDPWKFDPKEVGTFHFNNSLDPCSFITDGPLHFICSCPWSKVKDLYNDLMECFEESFYVLHDKKEGLAYITMLENHVHYGDISTPEGKQKRIKMIDDFCYGWLIARKAP